jgi:F-type H+-transporting ATPase subunit b
MEEIVKVFGLDWKLLIVQAVNFGVLLFALWYFLYRPILAMLDARREKIEQGIHSAEKSQARLREIEEERNVVLKEATKSAEDILASSKERAEEQASHIVSTANIRADSLLQGATKRAQEAHERALRESKKEIGKAAILAAEKILRKG